MPPGPKLLLLMLLSALCCYITVSIFHPHPNSAQDSSASTEAPQRITPPPIPFELKKPMGDLINAIKTHTTSKPDLKPGIFVVEPDTGKFVDIDARRAYPAASMIKLPILVRLLQAIDDGTVKFDQKVVVRQDLIGGGSGWLQWRKPGTAVTLEETAELMMIVSDNTATNMVIDVLGGKDDFNKRFADWGLSQTRINNWLPDLQGTNTTSPFDLALVLARVDSGQLLKPETRAWFFKVLERNRIRTLIPRGVPAGTKVADKTGDIGKLVGDAGIITTKDGKRYICTVAVERPWNDRRANALIRRISKDTYIGVTGDTEGAKTVIVDDEQKPAPKQATKRKRKRHR